MQTNRVEIGDGISLFCAKTDKFKHAALSISYTSKLNNENAAMNALLCSVLTHSCEAYPKISDFNRKLDELYAANISGNVKKFGEAHITCIEGSVIRNRYIPDGENVVSEFIKLMCDVLFRPAFDKKGLFFADVVENEKKNLIDEIRAFSNNKDRYAVRRCEEIMCENEKYSTFAYGTEEEVLAITPEKLTERYKSVISSAKFDIFFVGDYDETEIAEMLKKEFDGVKRNLSLDSIHTKVKRKASGEIKEICEHQPITQAKLAMGFRLGRSLEDRNYAAIELFRELYGGGVTSKLFVNVREKLSLCYYCSPIVRAIKGIMVVASAIESENKEKAQAEILAQLEEIKNGNITDEEFQNAKDSLINSYNQIDDSPESIIDWYMYRGTLGFVDPPELAAQAISYLTKEQLILAAKDVCLDTVYFLDGEAKQEG